jgi:hypothetical protein
VAYQLKRENPIFLNEFEEDKKRAGWRGRAILLSGLELDCDRKVQLPRSCTQRHTEDFAGTARGCAINAGVAWVSGVDDVEDVERLHTEFGRYTFADRDGLDQCQIVIE